MLKVISGVPQGSVLGPILFVIFINDLPDKIKNVIKLFADDTKVISLIDNENDSSILQEDLNNLHEWSKQWFMDINEDKCVAMHFGSNNKNYEYSLNSHKLTESHQERDLGVIFSKYLKNSAHIAVATRKANYALSIIKRSFKCRDKLTIKKLTSLVRPHLEYAVQVWNP
ncbi:unnamed protein product [Brachionus calyciflorus]|uniref:Reverse transcriptase domain-containing protein n=1 Tax=Brachionus calyciflorus TaxID=104777 RepID=A0A813UDR4_9BILA|nr:unnamed protein product [Brachionus calyciflorus]